MATSPVFRSMFSSHEDETGGKRPVVFDILGPDWETSLLPDGLKMVLHVNPQTMSIKHDRHVERIQTRGGYVEQHWGDKTQSIDFNMTTGGFMRLYTGLTATTGTLSGGSRRQAISYDKFLDMLALFHNNGSIFDTHGKIVFQGIVKITFDGGVFYGWFNTFSVTESADKPYSFEMTASFEVHKEIHVWRTTISTEATTYTTGLFGDEEPYDPGQTIVDSDL